VYHQLKFTFDAQVAADLTAETMAEALASRGRFADYCCCQGQRRLVGLVQRQLRAFAGRFSDDDGAGHPALGWLALEP
jgi:hypothetical protein